MPRHRRTPHDGSVLLIVLITTAALTTLMSAGLVRMITERFSAEHSRTLHQAFHAAEAGLDAAIVTSRLEGWLFRTHQGVAGDPDDPGLAVVGNPLGLPVCPATPTCLDVNGTGDYQLTLPTQTAAVQVWSDPVSPAFVRFRSTGTSDATSEQLLAVYEGGGGLLEYMFLAPGDVYLGAGQKVTVQGGSGRIFVDGELRIQTGSYSSDADFKAVRIEAKSIEVNGRLYRSKVDRNANVYITNTATGTEKLVPKYFEPGKTSPFSSTDIDWEGNPCPNCPPLYQSWLAQSPEDWLATGFIKEINTGARSFASVLPDLPDIDAYVDSFRSQATLTINGSADLPCGSGTSVPELANANTLELVNIVEIDVGRLEDCDGSGGPPKVLYSTVPIRLTNGAGLDADFTVASPHAVYVQGDFNTSSPKSAAVVTGNRVYYITDNFTDHDKFIDPSKVYDDQGKLVPGGYPTLAEAVSNFGQSKKAYQAFEKNYGPDVRPPWAAWMPNYYTDKTEQHMAIVSPKGPATWDHSLSPKEGLLEDGNWDNSGTVYNPKPKQRGRRATLERHGAFLTLPDTDLTSVCLNYPTCSSTAPQDKRAPGLASFNAKTGLVDETVYDPNLSLSPPPGFKDAPGGGGSGGTRAYWGSSSQQPSGM